MDSRPVLYVIGILLSVMSLGLILPLLADLYAGHADWKIFLLCLIFTAFFGGSLVLSNAGQKFKLSVRQAFLLVFLSWITVATFGALPFCFSELNLSYTDSFFEAMSGVTTTGSTIIIGLDNAPPGILLWRAILQWLGGIGIILMALSVLPFLNVGGMQIFKTELSESEHALPRTARLASSIGLIYLMLTSLCAIGYMFTGMGTFDAVAHAMTTLSTGGFSTSDESFKHYAGSGADIIAILFMIIGALPFILYLKAIEGSLAPLFKDTQVRWFLSIVGSTIIVLVLFLITRHNMPVLEALRLSAFNTVSVITGTGYANSDYTIWGSFASSLLFFLMVIGGCAGSTSCGIKIFRFQVLYAITRVQIQKLLYPHAVFIAHYNKKPLSADIPISVMSFFFLFALTFSLLTIALSFTGLDFITALSGSATSLANVGPGMGSIIGPVGTFQPLPDSAKWILSAGMLLGRLEIFTVLILFSPKFWKY